MGWYIFYGLGLIVLAVGIILFFSNKKRGRESVFGLIAVLFVVSFIWYIPIEISQDTYTVYEGILSAFLQGVAVLKADGYSKNTEGYWWVYSLYSASIMAVRIAVLPLIFGVILSFFRLPYQIFLNKIYKNRRPYVFIGVTNKNINIAKSLYMKEKCRLIFVAQKSAEDEKRTELNELDAFLFETGIGYVFSKIIKDDSRYSEKNPVQIFVFEETEEENLLYLQELADVLKADTKRHSRIYAETDRLYWNNQNGIQLNIEKDTMITVSFVRTCDNFAYNNLYNFNLLQNYVEKDQKKLVKVLMIGMDRFSLAMLKSMTWLLQIPGFKLELCAVDSGTYIEKFRFSYPGIELEADEEGMASYSLNLYENIDYGSKEFEDIINRHSDFTYAFINSLDSVTNSNLLDYLVTVRLRNKENNTYHIQIKNDSKTVFENLNNYPWDHVTEVGNLSEMYSYDFITDSEMEKAGRLVHTQRQLEKEEDKRVSWEYYCKDEYMRGSALARVLGLKYKIYVINKFYDGDYTLLKSESWMKAEHMRWSVYTWFLGIVYGEQSDRKLGKTHNDLKNYRYLDEKIKGYDAIDVNDEIVKACTFF